MILFGGPFDQKYLLRDTLPVGATVGILHNGTVSIYKMTDNGYAEYVPGQYRMDSAALEKELSDTGE